MIWKLGTLDKVKSMPWSQLGHQAAGQPAVDPGLPAAAAAGAGRGAQEASGAARAVLALCRHAQRVADYPAGDPGRASAGGAAATGTALRAKGHPTKRNRSFGPLTSPHSEYESASLELVVFALAQQAP